MDITYEDSSKFSRLVAMNAIEQSESRGEELRVFFNDSGSVMNAVVSDSNKETVVEAIATLMYNQDIEIEEIASALTAKSLIGEPKKRGRYILMPIEVGEEL